MTTSSRRLRAPVVLAMLSLVLSAVMAPVTAAPGSPPSPVGSASRTVLFASDGMRPDLMQKYAAQGVMPTYSALMAAGATGDNGMLQAFPPNTGVGWFTLATGAYPADHGSTNNTYFRNGDVFSNRTSFSAAGVLQADTIANAAERAGKKVAQIDWVGGASANINGPTVDFTNFFSNRGVLVGAADPTEQAGSAFFGVTYEVAAVSLASGWTNVPTGDPAAAPKQATWTINSTFAAQNPNRTYNVYFYDSVVDGTAAFDHVIVSPVGKTGSAPSLDLKVGDFLPLKLTGADGLIGPRAGQAVGHYIKLISLAPDASQFKLYDTSLARAIAKCGTPCNGLPAGGVGEDRLEKYIADNLLPWAAADFAPEEAGVIDEDTYVQQGRDLERAYSLQVINYILGTLQTDTDLAMVGYPFTDEVSHQFMGLVSPTDADGDPNPCYDAAPKFSDVKCSDAPKAGRVAQREEYIRSAYVDADEKLGITRSLMGGNPTTFAGSDHGFAPQWYAVNANKVLNDATVMSNGVATSLHASNANASNCGAATTDITKACWAGGTIQIYINAARLKSTANPSFPTYDDVRAAIRTAFQAVTDPGNPGKQVILKIMNKEELRDVDGSDSLHPNRSGDVVVVTRPPYQADSGTNGQVIALSHFFGQHGYLPNTVDLANNINMHGTWVMAGPGVKPKTAVKDLRAVDMAPTIALLMGIPGPMNARGAIRYDIIKGGDALREVTILDISDYHGQLTPLTDTPDTISGTGTANPSFNIGGAAFLRSWFATYEAEAARTGKNPAVIEMAAGDSIGATPPISNFFGDKPTIEIMNMMGIDIDGLGNHNFDYGADYFRQQLVPLAKYPFVSSNIVDVNGNTPAEWKKSYTFHFSGNLDVSVVGFSNDDIPSLTRPGALDPFHVANSLTSTNAEAAKVAGSEAVVAIGHLGATDGTLTSPTGPLLDLANGVQNVDVVIGDHTDQQALTTTSKGVLVTENRSKGLRFTRVRMVIGAGNSRIVYKTADFHKPWDVGVTPDPAIQAKINDLNTQLAPIFNTVVGKSTKVIPRADACGHPTGRNCESFIGDLVTDAIRSAYSTDFALTNSGGLRADLTCPVGGSDPNPSDFCPPSVYPNPDADGHYTITRGQVLGVLPFGNVSATLTINGSELKDYLETAVSSITTAGNGRFGEVSGLCFTYDIEGQPATIGSNGFMTAGTGTRVLGAVRMAADGTCTATPISFSSAINYTLTTNDFTASGGDSYPNNRSRMTTQDTLDQDLADYIATLPDNLVDPKLGPRIVCTDSDLSNTNACPVVLP